MPFIIRLTNPFKADPRAQHALDKFPSGHAF
ncbi:MAG: hypothetical protein ACI9X4_000581, partial [Glaciecola sp.]